MDEIEETMDDTRDLESDLELEGDVDLVGDNLKKKRGPSNADRCSKQASKNVYRKKRKFAGNRYTKKETTATTSKKKKTVSEQKLKYVKKQKKIEPVEGYRIVDLSVLQLMIQCVACPNCYSISLYIEEDDSKKKGLSSFLSINCMECDFSTSTFTSKLTEEGNKPGRSSFDINVRSVYAFRSIGIGYKGLNKFCGLMNMPAPMTSMNYDKISDKLQEAAASIAELSMKTAAKEAVVSNGGSSDIGVSVDGTWQRRGYVSLNGVIVAISMNVGKVIDAEIMSRFCRQCEVMRRRLNEDEFGQWFDQHSVTDCTMNHNGTAPAMECVGAKRIFERSIEKRGVRYMEYYGDGDSKGFETVKHVYGDVEVAKKECVGHYQKRVGTRLLNLKKRTGGKVLKELTKPIIDKLQNYFGIALRSNTESVDAMQKALFASFLHIASSEANNWHDNCDESWCQYKRDLKNSTNLYKSGKGLSPNVVKLVRPIYIDLMKEEELQKCLHGRTQNHNESFNGTVWERIPKNNYVGLSKLRLGVNDAIVNFNDGRQGTIDILNSIGMNPGYYTTSFCRLSNIKRKSTSKYKMRDDVKKARKIIRAQKKIRSANKKKAEGKTYKKGGF